MKAITDVNLKCQNFVQFSCSLYKRSPDYSDKIILTEVNERNIEGLVVPDDAYRFTFFDLVMGSVRIGDKQITVSSEKVNQSGYYYYGSKVLTHEEFLARAREEMCLHIIYRAHKYNWKQVVLTRHGDYKKFEDSDILIQTEIPLPEKELVKITLTDEILSGYKGGEFIHYQEKNIVGKIEKIIMKEGLICITYTDMTQMPFEQSLKKCETRLRQSDRALCFFPSVDWTEEYYRGSWTCLRPPRNEAVLSSKVILYIYD